MKQNIILETKNLTKKIKGFTVVDDVNLKIQSGHIHALTGPNGAGKTTVINLLAKYLTPTSGSVYLNGQDITSMEALSVARLGIVSSSQIAKVFPDLTVLETIRIALQRQEGNSFHFWASGNVLNKLNVRAEELLDSIGLSQFSNMTTESLSLGHKRALEIATTLALDPEMLLLDEPLQGMGQEDASVVADLIRKLSAHCTILWVEQDLDLLARHADRITVLQRGAVLTEGDCGTVLADPRIREAYLDIVVDQQGAAA